MSEETNLPATFVHGDVYDAPTLIKKKFDLVFTTWGTINWLPDMAKWSAVVAAMIKRRGRLYLADGHPAMLVMEEQEGQLVHKYSWRTDPGAPLHFDEEITYTGDPMPPAGSDSFDWAHPLSSIIGGLLHAGLRLDFLHEHETVAWPYVALMVPDPGEPRMFRLPERLPKMPLSFLLGATKQ